MKVITVMVELKVHPQMDHLVLVWVKQRKLEETFVLRESIVLLQPQYPATVLLVLIYLIKVRGHKMNVLHVHQVNIVQIQQCKHPQEIVLLVTFVVQDKYPQQLFVAIKICTVLKVLKQ